MQTAINRHLPGRAGPVHGSLHTQDFNFMRDKHTYKGNKSHLPSKPCAVCQREMTWRRAWARNWDEVRYCSEACRRKRPRPGAPSRG